MPPLSLRRRTTPFPTVTTDTDGSYLIHVLGVQAATTPWASTNTEQRVNRSNGVSSAGVAMLVADRPMLEAGTSTAASASTSTNEVGIRYTIAIRSAVTTTRYSYDNTSDSPAAVFDAGDNILERTIGLSGGATLTKRATGQDVWSYPNIHGDIVATADNTGTKTGTYTYDPYGQALTNTPDNSSSNFDYGWLGQHQRGLEHEPGINTIEMGARQYSPTLGRFLRVDPVEGGCANDYSYGYGDPVNGQDLDGRNFLCSLAAFFSWGAVAQDLRRSGAYTSARNVVISGTVQHVAERALRRSAARWGVRSLVGRTLMGVADIISWGGSVSGQGVFGLVYAGCLVGDYRYSRRWRMGMTADVPRPQDFNGSGIPYCNAGRCFA